MVLGLAAVSRTITELKRSDAEVQEPGSGPKAQEAVHKNSVKSSVHSTLPYLECQ